MIAYRQRNGFTLVELMIAVTIVGILAAMVIPTYQGYIRDGDVKRCSEYIKISRAIIDLTIINNGGSAESVSLEGLGLDNDRDQCEAGITLVTASADGAVVIRGRTGVVGNESYERLFSLERSPTNGRWVCTLAEADGTVLSADSCNEIK